MSRLHSRLADNYKPMALVFIFLWGLSSLSDAAVAITKHGPREGRVIVRESIDRIVVTVLTEDKRLYQFYAKDVESVTSPTQNLVGEPTWLYQENNESSTPMIRLSRGLEVIVLDERTDADSEWVQVRAWGQQTGWIKRSVLTNRVVFTPKKNLSHCLECRTMTLPALRQTMPPIKKNRHPARRSNRPLPLSMIWRSIKTRDESLTIILGG